MKTIVRGHERKNHVLRDNQYARRVDSIRIRFSFLLHRARLFD
jgi:hypothetical protein